MKVAIIGAGNMGGAVCEGLVFNGLQGIGKGDALQIAALKGRSID